MKYLVGAIAGVLLVIGVSALNGQYAPSLAEYVPTPTLTACPTEDSDNCYWDAQTMGDGEGRSFYVVDGVVTYTD